MASVLPRRNRDGSLSWRVQFRIDRKMRQVTFSGEKAEKDARQFGRRLDSVGPDAALAMHAASSDPTSGATSFEDFARRYLDPKSGMLTGIEKGTRKDYLGIVERSFLPVFGNCAIEDITRIDVGRWVSWQEDQDSIRTKGSKVSAKTVKNYHALLSGILAAAVDQKLIDDNPAYKIRLTRGRAKAIDFLTKPEFFTLLQFIPDYYKPLVMFLVGTGARWGEATAVTWGDVDTSSTPATVHIDKAWKRGENGPVLGTTKTERSRRTISLWPALIPMLGPRRRGNELLFPGAMGHGAVWYGNFKTRIWDRAVELANDEASCAAVGRTPIGKWPTIHSLRHTHASWLIAAGAPLPYVQVRLGHESINTTVNRYTHLLPNAHVEMAAIMQDSLDEPAPLQEVTA